MFEKATRLKLRFTTAKGILTVEDLWDIPLLGGSTNLDQIARNLYNKLQSNENMSFVTEKPKADTQLNLMFDIVKHIIKVRLEENGIKAQAKANKEKRQKLLEILDRKQNAAYESLSTDEIRKLIDEATPT